MKYTTMTTFKANKKGFIYILILSLLFPILLLYFSTDYSWGNLTLLLPAIIPFAICLWVYLDTKYWVDNTHLYYRSGILRGKVAIATINEVTIGKTLWVGTKPALAGKGLIIKFNKFDEVYIAPEDASTLVKTLINYNPSIKLIVF